MSADLYIHVMAGCTVDDLRHFFSNTLGHRFGIQDLAAHMRSKDMAERCQNSFECPICYRVGHTPKHWIGQVSWLKAALFEDEETYIPAPVEAIDALIDGEDAPPDSCTILTEELRDKILAALNLENKTMYEVVRTRMAQRKAEEDVEDYESGHNSLPDFLNAYIGYPIFTISW